MFLVLLSITSLARLLLMGFFSLETIRILFLFYGASSGHQPHPGIPHISPNVIGVFTWNFNREN
jgi:hypothetical protein